ncbi:MAG: hypothetical protein ACOCXA_07990 [Planctomycetota bacterium]
MTQSLRIDVRHHNHRHFRAGISLDFALLGTARPELDIDVHAACGYGQDLSPAVRQVLRSEIIAGIQMALRKAEQPGWQVVLRHFTAEPSILEVPSAGFAVAATLATLHVTGQEDLEEHPRGGFDWDLEGFQVLPSA